MIHPTAIVHPNAKIGAHVEIGAYSIIGEHVEIGCAELSQRCQRSLTSIAVDLGRASQVDATERLERAARRSAERDRLVGVGQVHLQDAHGHEMRAETGHQLEGEGVAPATADADVEDGRVDRLACAAAAQGQPAARGDPGGHRLPHEEVEQHVPVVQ